MLKRYLLIALAGTATIPQQAAAQTPGGLEVGAEVFRYGYRESVGGDDVVQDDGTFVGLHIGYTQTLGSGWFLRGSFAFAAGSVDYRSTGAVLDEGGPEARIDGVSQSIGRGEIQVGKDFRAGVTTITPFLGLGGRVLIDDSGGETTDTGLLGYDREVTYSYVSLGLATRAPLGTRTSLVLSGQYNWVVGGTAASRFSEIDPELPNFEFELEGNGYELSAAVEFPVGRNALRVGPYLRRWNIDRSASLFIINPDDPSEALELFEPENRTSELGMRITYAF